MVKGEQQRTRSGSDTSTRQIKRAVKDWRRVDFYSYASPTDLVATGYVCGMDDFHWSVADTQRRKVVLIHKSAAFVVLHETSTIENEQEKTWIEQVASPFHHWAEADHNGQPTDERATS